MGILKKQSINAAVISILGIVLGAFTTLIFQTKYLSPEMIGLISTLREVATILSSFVVLGAPSIINRFYPYFKDEKFKEFNFLVHLLTAIGLGILAVLLYLNQDFIVRKFAANSPLFIKYLFLIFPFTVMWSVKTLYEAYARSFYKITVPKLVNELILRVLFLILILAYAYFNWSNNAFIGGYTLVFFVSTLILIIYSNYQRRINFSFKFVKTGMKDIKELIVYGFYAILNTAGSTIVTKIDIIMLSSLAGLDKTGIYTIAMFMGSVIETPKRTLTQISVPFIADAWKENNLKKIETLYKQTALNQLITGFFLFSIIWINIDNIFNIIPNGEIFKEGKYVLFFLGLARLFDLALGANAEIIGLSKYYRVNIVISMILVIVTIITNYIFIPIYGIVGAALASAIAIFSYNIARFLYIWYAFKMQPIDFKFLKALTALVGIFVVVNFLPLHFHAIINIMISSALLGLGYFIAIYQFNISDELRNTLLGVMIKLGIRKNL